MREIVRVAAAELPGDWLIVGGAVVALHLDADRTTADVDFVAFDQAAPPYPLYELAHKLGYPIETFNPAATFFVHRIPGWREHTVLLEQGAAGRIFRPDSTLLILSKLDRLSERDLLDCLAAAEVAEELDRPWVLEALEGRTGPRVDALRQALLALQA